MHWDPLSTSHLANLTAQAQEAGVLDYVQRVISALWRANVDRHDPDGLYDDGGTLGYNSSVNVSNQVFAELRGGRGALAPAAIAKREKASTVIVVGDLQIRLVKAPVARGMNPRFTSDFTWEEREGRYAPAARNAAHYIAPLAVIGHAPFFEIPAPDAAERVAQCQDMFVVWGGDMDGRTSGWTGLPVLGHNRFLAVQEVWQDAAAVAPTIEDETSEASIGFSNMEVVQPKLTLKTKRNEFGNA